MNTRRIFYLGTGIILFLIVGILNPVSANTVLPDIQKTYKARTKSVHITANDKRTKDLAMIAFNAHGAFKLTNKKGSDYTLEFTNNGNGSVNVKVLVSANSKLQLNYDARGQDADHAVLVASDAVVLKLTGLQGFFAGNLTFMSDKNGSKEIYRSDMFFYKVSRLTSHRSDSITPRWSPDGSKIVYVSYFKSGYPDLFIYDLYQRQIKTFASFTGVNQGGEFSPDGRYNAMILSSSGNPELYIADAAGRNPRRYTRNRAIESSPSWSYDSRRLVLASDKRGSPQLYIVNLSGGKMQELPTRMSGYCAEPDWNHYHTNLILFTASAGGKFQLAVYDMNAGESRWLTSGSGDSMEGKWLNDGRHIVFTKRNGRVQGLYILDSETGKTAPLHSKQFGNAGQADFVYLR